MRLTGLQLLQTVLRHVLSSYESVIILDNLSGLYGAGRVVRDDQRRGRDGKRRKNPRRADTEASEGTRQIT